MHEKYVKILLKDYVEPTYIREGQKSESMQKCIEVMDKMIKPNQNELDFWRCAVNQGPQYLFNGQNTQIVKYVHNIGGENTFLCI